MDFIIQKLNCNIFEISYVEVNGCKYKSPYAIYLCNNKNNDPVFGVIHRVLKNNKNDIFFTYKKCVTIGFNNHIKAYIVEPCIEKREELYIFNIDCKEYLRPMKIHITADGCNVISRRELE